MVAQKEKYHSLVPSLAGESVPLSPSSSRIRKLQVKSLLFQTASVHLSYLRLVLKKALDLKNKTHTNIMKHALKTNNQALGEKRAGNIRLCVFAPRNI